MRFRGKIVEPGSIQHFARVIGTIAKLVKTCILRITLDKLYFILSERVTNGGIAIWCELAQSHFFAEYNMDGVSPEANEIYLEIVPENLNKALRTTASSRSLKIKLTKKSVPCLTFEIEQPTLTQASRLVVHDVPVNVIPRRLWSEYEEPSVPLFDVSVYMPQVKMLKSVTDRMKNLSNYVTLMTNAEGEMRLCIETDLAKVTTRFELLERPILPPGSDKDDARTAKDFVEARIDIRKFAQFLAGHQHSPVKILCNIVHQKVVHFLVIHDDVSLQYFIPVISL